MSPAEFVYEQSPQHNLISNPSKSRQRKLNIHLISASGLAAILVCALSDLPRSTTEDNSLTNLIGNHGISRPS